MEGYPGSKFSAHSVNLLSELGKSKNPLGYFQVQFLVILF